MRTRIKALVAIVIASAALGGAVAAPASADPPLYDYLFTCVGVGFDVTRQDINVTSKEAHQVANEVRKFCRDEVVDGTFTSAITRA